MVQRLSLAEIILRLAFSRALHLFQACSTPKHGDWSRKLASSSYPIKFTSKTNLD